ncbi:MAG: hypothetical protein P8K68_03635 [Algibacter sp.]|uniref:hypothetical protein n=1 Tax=Algibacter sp. TaxID=1872428 RepID=UPI00261BD8D6|nr:hypothetical protein [Algibacter sp.]MDG1730700.1 hypothetical protein [Algibacter sp.]MDG2177865.1 hypothetical protein [Algibacter sp.]
MKNIAYLLMLWLFSINYSFAQVGIGTTNPTAELEIETSDVGNPLLDIPALEINPQVSHVPIGTTTGQISVIGDKLYMYDGTRNKWLSIETTKLHFGRGGARSNEVMRYVGSFGNQNSSALMPFDGTIVYISARARAGLANKDFSVEIRNANAIIGTANTYSLVSREFIDTTVNNDFSAGDYIISRIENTPNNATVQDLIVTIWVKWRQ